MSEIIRKIIMKPGTSKSKFLKFASWLDSHGKLLAEEKTEDDRFVAVACFDNKIDYLAFLVSTGLCHIDVSVRKAGQ